MNIVSTVTRLTALLLAPPMTPRAANAPAGRDAAQRTSPKLANHETLPQYFRRHGW